MNPAFLSFAHTLADAAGAVIRPYFGAHGDVENKADASPVTIADRVAEQAMRDLIAARFPEHAIFGEEFGKKEGAGDWGLETRKAGLQPPVPIPLYTWVLDPIDGTRAFIAGKKEWGTLIALCENGVPILGVLDQPITGERWVGAVGQGARYFNKRPHPKSLSMISTSPKGEVTLKARSGDTSPLGEVGALLGATAEGISSRTCTSLSHASISTTSRNYFTPTQATAFVKLAEQCGEVIENGDCYAYGMLARGERDAVVDAGLKPYDILALVPIIKAAGGKITAWDGAPITLTHFSTALATGDVARHSEILDILNKSV
jgi:inositol-phosphate phosphatase/L-galactose 1-phosphate phosphatase/histidinol-phosphatase